MSSDNLFLLCHQIIYSCYALLHPRAVHTLSLGHKHSIELILWVILYYSLLFFFQSVMFLCVSCLTRNFSWEVIALLLSSFLLWYSTLSQSTYGMFFIDHLFLYYAAFHSVELYLDTFCVLFLFRSFLEHKTSMNYMLATRLFQDR